MTIYKKSRGKKLSLLDWIILYATLGYGFIYFFLPHSLHTKGWALDWVLGLDYLHSVHVALGGVLLAIGFMFLMRKRKTMFKNSTLRLALISLAIGGIAKGLDLLWHLVFI